MQTLQDIHQKWHDANNCALKNTATQPVFGDGNPKSKIVFIGEAPGKDEDREGKPFVGRSGKFLSEMLESIKMKREDIYITNVVKYRPPDNRDPLPDEIAASLPWLMEELNFVKPLIVIFLGRHAMERFFPTEKISQIHGTLLHKKIKGFDTEYFLPLHHPAAALYNGSMRDTLIEDFKKIPLILEEIKNV